MARVFSPTLLLQRTGVPPVAYGAGTLYPLVIPDITAVPGGLKALDVIAAMFGRVLSWRIDYTASISGVWELGDFSNTIFTLGGSASGTYFTDGIAIPGIVDSEKYIAYGQGITIDAALFSGGVAGVGSWNMVRSIDGEPDEISTGDYLVGMSASWSGGPIIVAGNELYCTFGGSFSAVPSLVTGTDDYPEYGTISGSPLQGDPVTQPQCGNWHMTTPDWRYGGANSALTATMYDVSVGTASQYLTSGSVSINLTASPYLCLPYGFDPDNPTLRTTIDSIWNDDGTIQRNPLAPGA